MSSYRSGVLHQSYLDYRKAMKEIIKSEQLTPKEYGMMLQKKKRRKK